MSEPNDPVPDPSEQGISLDELAQAFAQVMGTAPKSGVATTTAEQPAIDTPAGGPSVSRPEGAEPMTPADGAACGPADAPAEPDDSSCPVSPQTILEAMLFVGDRDNRPFTPGRAAELMRGIERGDVPGLVEDLNRRYASNGCPYYIASEGDGYRMTLRGPFHRLREKFYGRIRQARLSQAAIDVLAIVAYQQPLSAEQIGKVRGKPSNHVLAQLVHRGLLRLERQPGKRRTALYYTTDRFLQLFALETLADLPQSEELDRK
jgi:segregation and condensation protein B